MIKNCVLCNKKFVWSLQHQKYCSKECLFQDREQQIRKLYPTVKKNCVICNKEFITNLQRKKCCSKDCSKKYSLKFQRQKYKDKEMKYYNKICIYCGKNFITTKLHQNKCNKICAKLFKEQRIKNVHYYKKKENIIKICKWCEKEFIINKKHQIFCKKECALRYKMKAKIIEYKVCVICKKEFITSKYKQKITCSKECALKQYKQKCKISNRYKYYNNEKYRFRVCMSNNINYRLKGYKKLSKTHELIGCTYEQLKQHIIKQFQPGMTWENRGVYTWHIDHIKPLALFDLSKKEEQLKVNHYTNFQPLWAIDNIKKGKKYVEENKTLPAGEFL